MQLFKIGLIRLHPEITTGEIHMAFTVEEKCKEWIAVNNKLAVDYDGLPMYSFLGVLYAS